MNARTDNERAPIEDEWSDESSFGNRILRLPLPQGFYAREDEWATALVVLNLLVVLAAGPLAYRVGRPWAYLLAFALVGARAEALYILQHECMHLLLFTRRSVNDAVGMALSGLLGTRLFEGRRVHFKHHREVGTLTDPNKVWHGTEGRAPGWQSLRFFAFQLAGGRLVSILGQLVPVVLGRSRARSVQDGPQLTSRQLWLDLGVLAGMQLGVLAAISVASAPWVYFALYLAPLLTLTSLFEAFRSFSEHVLPGDGPTSEPERHRLYFMDAGRIELFFISAFHFNYHHLHHLYPGIVTFKLPTLHTWLQEHDPEYASKYVRRSSYVGTAVRYVLNRPIAGAGTTYPKEPTT